VQFSLSHALQQPFASPLCHLLVPANIFVGNGLAFRDELFGD
jgi:hypothetical protein